MSRNQRIARALHGPGTFQNIQIASADTTSAYAQQEIIFADVGHRHLPQSVTMRLSNQKGLHADIKCAPGEGQKQPARHSFPAPLQPGAVRKSGSAWKASAARPPGSRTTGTGRPECTNDSVSESHPPRWDR